MLQSIHELIKKLASYTLRNPATENPPTSLTQGLPSKVPPKYEPKKPTRPGLKPMPKPATPKPSGKPSDNGISKDPSDRSDDTKKLRLLDKLKTLTNQRQQELIDAENENRDPDTKSIDDKKTQLDLQVDRINENQLKRKMQKRLGL